MLAKIDFIITLQFLSSKACVYALSKCFSQTYAGARLAPFPRDMYYIRPLILLILDQNHRRNIMLVRTHIIVHRCRHNHHHEDDNRPVHTRSIGVGARREETHHEAHNEESQRHIVNGATPLPQRPAAREQGLVAEALEA